MSVAGILASSLFANAGSQIRQTPPSTANTGSGAQSPFAALQQKLMGSSGSTGSTAGASSIPAQLTQLGQDLKSGNLTAAQADFSTFKMTLAQAQTQMLHHFHAGSTGSSGSQTGSSGTSGALLTGSSGLSGQSGAGSDPLAAAMLAYSSLQQNAANGSLSSSLMTPTSTFGIDA